MKGIKDYERIMLQPFCSKLMQYHLRLSDLNMKIEEKLKLFTNHALRRILTRISLTLIFLRQHIKKVEICTS